MITAFIEAPVGLFSGKPSPSAKMKTLKVSLDAPSKPGKKTSKKAQKNAGPMSFTEWVEHYAKMSKGNPV